MDTVEKKAEFDPVYLWFYGDGIWIQWKKAELDLVHLWFYGDGIWMQWKRKQNWILYIYGFMESGYGYSG